MMDHPEALWLLVLLVPVLLLLIRRYLTGVRDIRVLAGGWRRLSYENVYLVKWFFSSLTFALFVVSTVLALAGFRWGEVPISEEVRGYQTVLAIDVSRSMLAQDVTPSRLARTSAVLRSFVERSAPGSQFALVVFKGSAVVAVPMTEDTAALVSFLDALSPDMLTSVGTSVEAGINASLDAFPAGTQAHRTVILVSDGDSLDGNPARAAARAQERRVVMHTVGAGTRTPVPIPIGNGSYVRDSAGNIVEVPLRENVLIDIAERTSGTYIRLDDPRVSALLAELVVGGERRRTFGYHFDLESRYRMFVLLALGLLGMSLAIRSVRWGEGI